MSQRERAARAKEIRVAPNIYKIVDAGGRHVGWRVFVRSAHPKTGLSRLAPKRFKSDVTIEELEHFRDAHKLERRRLVRARRRDRRAAVPSGFAADAKTYLELPTTKAMPSYKTRAYRIGQWVEAFGDRPRRSITTRDIDQQLQRFTNEGYAADTVNNMRTALQAMYSRLDGRAAANPVREAMVFEPPELEPRAIPYDLVVRILDAIPATRSYSHLRATKVNPVKTRIRLEVMAWTGIRPAQLAAIVREDVDFTAHRYRLPRSKKGSKRSRTPRLAVWLPLSAAADAAFTRFFAAKCEGAFSTSSARRLFMEAVTTVQAHIRQQRGDPAFTLPKMRLYDLRHAFGTEILRQTRSLETTAQLLGQTSTRMTKRYALGAISEVLQHAAAAFESSTTGGKRTIDETPAAPRPPKRRK